MTTIVRRIGYQWLVHDNPSSAAAIAFYSLFTLAPTLIFGVTFGKLAIGLSDAPAALRNALVEVVTPQQADALLSLISGDGLTQGGVLASIVAGVLLLWGASATFAQLRVAFNRIFDLSADTIREQIHTTVVGRLLAAVFVILMGVLEFALIGFNVMLSRFAERLSHLGWLPLDSLRLLSYVVSWLVVGLLFAGLLKYLPMRSPKWRHVLPGALVSVVLFQFGKYVIGWYLARAIIASAYGTSSSLVAIMIWIYYSSQTLLLGAEVTHDAAQRSKLAT
jgi:membrane protein